MIGRGETTPRCSSNGCRGEAIWRVNWRNPRLHEADRVKVWLACDEHRHSLDGYLRSRGFPTLVTPYDQAAERVPDVA